MSTVKTDTLQNVAGTKSVPVDTVVDGSAKAWVNFNGTGTVAIRAAFNVTSITDNGTGSFTLNFTSAMPDANYAFVGHAYSPGASVGFMFGPETSAGNKTASSFRVQTANSTFVATDHTQNDVAIFR